MISRKTDFPKKLFSSFIAVLLCINFAVSVNSQTARKTRQKNKSAQNRSINQAEETRRIESILQNLTLREKIGQMIVVGSLGEYRNTSGEKFADIKKQISENKVGGFVFYRGDVYELAALTNEMQSISKIPLLMAADFERGLPMQIKSGTSFTHNMGIAATGDAQNAYRKGRIIAEEMRALGINWLYGPVSDVANNAGNTMINVRSYGEIPQKTAEFVAAEVRGLKDGGVLSTAKHFPGHGDTPIDSHIDIAPINISRERFETVELAPFRAAIAAGLDSLMTAHIALPQITNDNLPASLSPEINKKLIRDELKFDGIITTDSLGMGAIVKNFKGADGALFAIKAGADIALLPPDPKAAIDAIEQAVTRGEIPQKQIDDSVKRILRAKYRMNLFAKKQVDLNQINKIIEKPENVRFADDLAEKSITLFRNENKIFPLSTDAAKKTLFVIAAGDDDFDQGAIFKTAIETRLKNVRVIKVDKRTTDDEYKEIVKDAKNFETVVIGAFVKRAALKGTIALPESEAEFIRRLIDERKNVAVIAFGSPYQIRQFPKVKNYAAAWAVEDVAQKAAARALFGETSITGKSPVSLSNFFKIGDGLQIDASKTRQKDAKDATEIFN